MYDTFFIYSLVGRDQGITEFLPISSSGPPDFATQLTGLQDQGRRLDVAVHVGTLGAVMLYFWLMCAKHHRGAEVALPVGRLDGPEAWLALCLRHRHHPGLVILLALCLRFHR